MFSPKDPCQSCSGPPFKDPQKVVLKAMEQKAQTIVATATKTVLSLSLI